MKNHTSYISKQIDTLSAIADDMTGLGALLCTHYDYLAQNGYDYKELLFLCDACGMLADNILQVGDHLLEIMNSLYDGNIVDIGKNQMNDNPIGA